jgi:anti-sigma regulatory factor (Ser/Thr protein kinase)
MGALLSTEASDGTPAIVIRDEASVSLLREAVRECGADVALDRARAESLVAAASEIAHNQLAHAGGGEMLVRKVVRRGVPGVEVLAADVGPGIPDPTAALRGEGRAAAGQSAGLGIGLSAAHRLADELDFDVRWGHGTRVWARKFASPLPRTEVAVLGRVCQGETALGDDALFLRRNGDLLLAVADGLGHGRLAQEPAAQAMAIVRDSLSLSPAELLRSCHAALAGSRGAVMAVVHIPEAGNELVQVGVGNIGCQLYRDRAAVRFPSTPGVVGQPGPLPRLREERAPLGGRHVVILFTDGLSSRIDLSADAALLREPPLLIAHRLITEHGRAHDDALVLVATG